MGVIGDFRARGRVFNLMELSFAESVKDHDDTDSFWNTVAKGTKHLEGYFLDSYNGVYRVSKKRAIFYKESVVYPFVQVTEEKKVFSWVMTSFF